MKWQIWCFTHKVPQYINGQNDLIHETNTDLSRDKSKLIGMLASLCVWVKVQICIWPGWCHCHSLSAVNPDWFYLSGAGSLRWSQTKFKKAVKWLRVCVCVCVRACMHVCKMGWNVLLVRIESCSFRTSQYLLVSQLCRLTLYTYYKNSPDRYVCMYVCLFNYSQIG